MVLNNQPWTFNKDSLVLDFLDDKLTPDPTTLKWCLFWVQCHGLPLCMMIGKVGIVLGESLGEIDAVENASKGVTWGNFL